MIERAKMPGLAITLIMLSMIVAFFTGCSTSDSGNGKNAGIESTDGTSDNPIDSGTGAIFDPNGSTGSTTGASCLTAFTDDFNGPLSDHWFMGTNTAQNPDGPTVATENGRVVFSQAYDYIETIDTFSGNFTISLDVFREADGYQCADYYIQLTAADRLAGIMRFPYGEYVRDSINIGSPPEIDTLDTRECVLTAPHLQEQDDDGESAGTISMTYANQAIQLMFTNGQGETITTPTVPTGNIADTKIRIWGIGAIGSKRYIDHLTVCEWQGDNDTSGTDNSGHDTPQTGSNSGTSHLSGSGTCENSEIALTVGNETKTLSLVVNKGFELGTANLYGCVWYSGSYGDQLLINGISPTVTMGANYSMDTSDPLQVSLVWNHMLYMPKAFTVTFDQWDGPGGQAQGTLSATLVNLMLDETITLKDVAFCGPIVY